MRSTEGSLRELISSGGAPRSDEGAEGRRSRRAVEGTYGGETKRPKAAFPDRNLDRPTNDNAPARPIRPLLSSLSSLILTLLLTGCSPTDDLFPKKVGRQWSYTVNTGFPTWVAPMRVT